MKTHSHNN